MSKQLKAAIEADDPVAAKSAMKSVKDLTRKLPGASAPVMYCCQKGADKVLKVLLDEGVPVKGVDGYAGNHPFVAACEKGHVATMKVLINHNAAPEDVVEHAVIDVAMHGMEKELRDVLKLVKVPITSKIFRMGAYSKNPQIIRVLAQGGGDLNQLEKLGSQERLTPLHAIVDDLNLEMIRTMVDLGADINARDGIGRTPLMLLGHHLEQLDVDEALDVMKKLIAMGAKADLVDTCGNDVIDHYRFEARRSRVETDSRVIKLLTKAGAKGSDSTYNLFMAMVDKNLAAAKKAIAAGADVNRQAPPHWNGTPLLMAWNSESARLLLDAGADPNKPAGNYVPLIEAASDGNLELVKTLLAAGAKLHAIQPMDPDDECVPDNALTAAEGKGHTEVVKYLKSLGATKPNLKWKPFEPGVASWNDFSETLIQADVASVARALAKMIGAKAVTGVYRKSFKPGKTAYVVIRPKGMNWSHVFRVAPARKRYGDEEADRKFAADLGKACKAASLQIDYSDTSDAASIVRFEPDGSSSRDDGWDYESLKEMVGAAGTNAPAWAKKKLKEMREDGPDSSARLNDLAKSEKFVAAAFGFHHDGKGLFEIDVPGYPAEAFDDVAWLSNP